MYFIYFVNIMVFGLLLGLVLGALLLVFETRSYYIALSGLELTMQTSFKRKTKNKNKI